MKESQNLPNKIRLSLEKGKKIDKEYNDIQLNILINECINIENNISKINIINESIKKYNDSIHLDLKFNPDNEEEIKEFLEKIKTFGYIRNNNIFLKQKSLICTENKEINFISKFLKKIKPKSKLNLIYRASTDGQMGKDFHSKCDNISPTITFFKTNNNVKFGGYTESNWDINGYSGDKNTYIFSISKEK